MSNGLPPLLLPAGFPAFRREGHGIELLPVYGDSPMQTGSARRRRNYISAPRIVSISLELTLEQIAAYKVWFEGPLQTGVEYFSAHVANQGPGLLWWKARVLEPMKEEYLGGLWWKLSGRLMLFGDGSIDGPDNYALTGHVTFDLLGEATLTVGQGLSGHVSFALLADTYDVEFLSGHVTFPLAAAAYTPPPSVASAAGTSTATGQSTSSIAVGSASGSSTANGISPLTVLLDSAFGTTRGTIIYRGATAWAVLAPGTASYAFVSNGSGADPSYKAPLQSIIIACSDEITALTAGVAKVTFRMPYAFKVTAVRASLTTAQTSGSIFTVDVNESGASIISTKLTIDNTEKTSTTAVTAPVISDVDLADDAEITVDIDQIGDGTAKGLKVMLIGYPVL